MPSTPRPVVLALAVLFGVVATACDDRRGAPQAGQTHFVGRDVEVIPLAAGVWRHVSKSEDGIAANGLVVETDEGLVLVDATWSDEQAEILLAWGRKKLGKRFAAAILTHDHADRTGGAAAVARHEIPITTHASTARALTSRGVPGVTAAVEDPGEAVRVAGGIEVFYPGAGHAPDNVVVWLPEREILFGGCMVKAADAAEIGNVGDADLESWPRAVRAVADRHPRPAIVVPGHGTPSGRAALERTLELVGEAAAQASG